MRLSKIVLAMAALGLVVAYFLLDPGQYLGPACHDGLLSLKCFNGQREALHGQVAAHGVTAAVVFFGVYVAVTALSIPGAAVMTLIGGALFGLVPGVLLVSFASALGATLAFLMARFVFRDVVQKRFGHRLGALDRGIERDGAYYLFALRLVPVFPFFVINLVMGLTRLRTLTFYWVSQLGMLAGTVVYVNAGTQLGQLQSLSGVLTPGLIGSFVLLGLFPLVARTTLDHLATRRALRGHARPRHFDRNIIVIGAGSAGLVASLIAATVKARVTLVEKHAMGGDCLNTGCVPSKALIRTARLVHEIRHSRDYGLHTASVDFSFADVMTRVKTVVATIAPHDSVERYRSLGVDCVQAGARVLDPWTVELDDGRRLTARTIILATGAEPYVPPIAGLADIDYLTSNNLWDLADLPPRLAVMGGGPIGCEMAQAFARLGSRVTLIEQGERLLSVEDAEFGRSVRDLFAGEGIDVRTSHRVVRVDTDDRGTRVHCEADTGAVSIHVDRVLVAVGRRARTRDMGLEALGIAVDGRIPVNERLQTRVPTIYACGDAIGGHQLTHAASHEAWHATVNALFGVFKTFAVDYTSLPWCTFTDPQVAHVGHNEQSARAAGLAFEVTRYDLAGLDRAIAESAARGVVKVLTVPGKDRVLGATIMAEGAGELITEFVTAIKHGIGLNKLLGTIHAYPTFSEANKFAAGEWKRAHAPAWIFPWLQRFHAWRR